MCEQLDDSLAPPDSVFMCQLRRLAKAHFIQTGGLIYGEGKLLTITLHMLARGSYLDLSLIFGMRTSYPYGFFCEVICHWICQLNLSRQMALSIA